MLNNHKEDTAGYGIRDSLKPFAKFHKPISGFQVDFTKAQTKTHLIKLVQRKIPRHTRLNYFMDNLTIAIYEAKDLKDAMVVMGRFVTVLAQPSILGDSNEV